LDHHEAFDDVIDVGFALFMQLDDSSFTAIDRFPVSGLAIFIFLEISVKLPY